MDATQALVTGAGKPTRQLIQLASALRTASTDPHLGANTRVVTPDGKPTRALIALLARLTGKAPNANVPIVNPANGFPTKPFLELVNE